MDSGSVLAVQGPQAASRPGLLRADPKGWLPALKSEACRFEGYRPCLRTPVAAPVKADPHPGEPHYVDDERISQQVREREGDNEDRGHL